MQLFDSHCHIQFDAYNDDREEVIQKTRDHGVGVLVVGDDYESSRTAVELAKNTADIWAAVGQHPTDTGLPFDQKKFFTLARAPRVVAIGECGLDYYRMQDTGDRAQIIDRQKELFQKHLELAHEAHLPLIVHCRDAHDDLTEMLVNRFGGTGASAIHGRREHGVMHCFVGTLSQAEVYLGLGFLISFTGIITFADQYDEVVRAVPLDKILIETDSPFLTPQPHRGKRNHPMYVEHVARRIAHLKNISFEEVASATTANAKRLFSLS